MAEFLVIEMQVNEATCALCHKPTCMGYAVAVNTVGEIVDDDYEGEWGGATVCKPCYDKAGRGEIKRVW